AGHLKISLFHGTIDAASTTGGIEVHTYGNGADAITFGSGADTFQPGVLDNIHPGTSLATGLDAAAMHLYNFNVAPDTIDLSSVTGGHTATSVFIDQHSNYFMTTHFANVQAAAEFVAANDGGRSVDVFQYGNSTYVFNDGNHNNHVDANSYDGLIRVV